jgi:hypothetical protein
MPVIGGCGVVEVESALRERATLQFRVHTSEGGQYGNEEGWQDQEESSCEEESCRQEEEVSSTSTSEAIY